MDGTTAAGSVLVIDHDRLFKELLEAFFFEFLDLFFPKLAHSVERDSIEFLSQEHFHNLLEGEKYHVDLLAKVRFKETEVFFLIHVEHQSTAPANFPVRFFRYFSAIFEKHGLPVYPIVIYSHDRPLKAQPDKFRVSFPDGEVLRFHYRVVQLNRLSWRKFVKAHNPVATALMAKMKIATRDRPKVKVECLRLMLTLRVDPVRMDLIGGFIDAYLRLNAKEERVFRRVAKQADLSQQEKEGVLEYVTSWERRGMEKGLEKGIEEGIERGIERGIEKGIEKGIERGRVEALRGVLWDILSSRFGPIEDAILERIGQIESADTLRNLTHLALTAKTLEELEIRDVQQPAPTA